MHAVVSRSAAISSSQLLFPPLPTLNDSPRPLPVLTSSSDFSTSSYNAAMGPAAPLPTLAPRLRSQHLLTRIASDKLKDDKQARRRAGNLKSSSSLSLLGLDAVVAAEVERVLAEGPAGAKAAQLKRKREDANGANGKGPAYSTTRGSAVARPSPGTGSSSLANLLQSNPITAPLSAGPLEADFDPYAAAVSGSSQAPVAGSSFYPTLPPLPSIAASSGFTLPALATPSTVPLHSATISSGSASSSAQP